MGLAAVRGGDPKGTIHAGVGFVDEPQEPMGLNSLLPSFGAVGRSRILEREEVPLLERVLRPGQCLFLSFCFPATTG